MLCHIAPSNYPKLQAHNIAITDLSLQLLAQNTEVLHELDIQGLPQISNRGIMDLLGVVQTAAGKAHTRSQVLVEGKGIGERITSLLLGGCVQLDDVTLVAISKCKHMQSVNLDNCPLFSDAGMQECLMRCTRMKSISMIRTGDRTYANSLGDGYEFSLGGRLTDASCHALLEVKVAYGFRPTGGFQQLLTLRLDDQLGELISSRMLRVLSVLINGQVWSVW